MKYNFLNVIPEGKAKVAMRKFYRSHVKPFNFAESRDEDGNYVYTFDNGITLKFTNTQFVNFSSPLRGYLKYYVPKNGDVVIDIGAFDGDFSLYVAKAVGPAGKVYALEPNPENFKRLKVHIAMNGIKNVIPLNLAIWSKSGTVDMSNEGPLSTIGASGTSQMKVRALTLEEFAKLAKLERIDFIKMDVEGAEIDILQGVGNVLEKYAPRFAIASYHLIDGKKSYTLVERFFKEKDYKFKTSAPYHLTTYGSKNKIKRH